jgi:hypothetical protein
MTTPAAPARDVRPLIWKITAGALIPAIATIIFNTLNFFLENYQRNPIPGLQASVFDFGVGCAFSLVGVCVATRDHALTNTCLIIFVSLLLLILGGGLAVIFLGLSKVAVIWMTNVVCFIALCWAIYKAG